MTSKDICPECGAEVLRTNLKRYGFCQNSDIVSNNGVVIKKGVCNILLNIPPLNEAWKEVHTILFREGWGPPQKITREEYCVLCAIKPFSQIRA